MRRIQLVLAGVFLGGILLGGIGTGISVVEYSSLSYGGEHRIGEENLVTDDFDFEFAPGECVVTIDDNYYLNRNYVRTIQTDPQVPVGVVRYQVTYNEKLVTPVLLVDRNTMEEDESGEVLLEESEEYPGDNQESPAEGTDQKKTVDLATIWLSATYQDHNLEILMQNKDRFLTELKNKVISDYKVLYITDVKVKVNPETVPYVKLGNDRT